MKHCADVLVVVSDEPDARVDLGCGARVCTVALVPGEDHTAIWAAHHRAERSVLDAPRIHEESIAIDPHDMRELRMLAETRLQ